MNFSEELNNFMDTLDCTSKDLCERSGLSPVLISRYINDKRTPKVNSVYLEKIISALYQIAQEKNIKLTKAKISSTLINAINAKDINYDAFVNNLNSLQEFLNVTTAELAKSISYDASFLSRIKSKERKPSDLDRFIDEITNYFFSLCTNQKQKDLSSLFQCSEDKLKDIKSFSNFLSNWLFKDHTDNNQSIMNFLSKLDDFNLNDYIKNTDYNKIKVPTAPVIIKNSKTYYGVDGRKKAEGEFMKITLLSKSKEPIFFFSNLPMSEASTDENFKKKTILAMTMLLKKGLHLNIVHTIDRPINEMLIGLESWIPIYMTGSISPYYFKNPPSNILTGSHCTSGSVALLSTCINHNEKNSKFYITTKKDEIEFEKQISKVMLSHAKSLMKIFKEKDKEDFEKFMKEKENKNYKEIKKDIFKNIDFYINENKWIMINKKTSPEIHFVIYNEKLMKAINSFLIQ